MINAMQLILINYVLRFFKCYFFLFPNRFPVSLRRFKRTVKALESVEIKVDIGENIKCTMDQKNGFLKYVWNSRYTTRAANFTRVIISLKRGQVYFLK